MPPNGNAGASTKSSFGHGNAKLKYWEYHLTARPFAAINESASASFARDARTYIVIGRPSIVLVTLAHGPAANAMRYVLIGLVCAKCTTSLAPDLWLPSIVPFATAFHAEGIVS